MNDPGSTFYNDRSTYPFSTTNGNHRPLAVQMDEIAYQSGADRNGLDFAIAEFNTLLDEARATPDVATRTEIVALMQAILRDEGGWCSPYWRAPINHRRKELGGGTRHIAAQMFGERLHWAA